MQTKIGDGSRTIKDFAVDFGDDHIYIGGKAYPKGYFANSILNITKEEMTSLLIIEAPAYHALQNFLGYGYSDESFDMAKDSVMKLKTELFQRMPFCLLDLETEEERLEFAFSDDVKDYLHDFWELLQKKDSTGTILDATVADEEKEFLETGRALYTYFRSILNFYVYAPMDFSNFSTAILNFEYSKLRDLKVRDEHNYAVASDEFFSDPLLPLMLFASQITPAVAGFTLKPNVRQEFVVVDDPTKKGQKIVSRRLHFCRIMDFLVTDFFEGLHAGHAPKQCPVCNRFFLTTNARPRKYCDGYAPNDSRGRTCQQVGARKKRDEREQADDHPVKQIYNTRCNTIDHHVRYGKIDRKFAETAKRIAKDRQSKALRDNEYYLKYYESEMTQETIYAAAEQELGRPPEKQNDSL